MISFLRGKLLGKAVPEVVVDVHGVGYEVLVSMTTFGKLPAVGEDVALYTHLSIREDAHVLYGFADLQERSLFRQLVKVSGVGPKMALAILSTMGADEFASRILADDVASLTRIPGVGKKTAERLLVEMRDRIRSEGWTLATGGMGSEDDAASGNRALWERETVAALVALGYSPQQASRALQSIREEVGSSEELIRLALKAMA
jgi:Holliday junction DNA helicase RuvA